MSLTAALMNSLSGMRASQTGLDIVSRNVANASTPGYTRKSADLEHIVLDGQGAGVRRLAVEREIDVRIQRELRIERAGSSRLDVVDSFLQRIDQMLGRPDEDVSFASSVKNLSNSFQELADKPEDPTLRGAVVSAADRLADDLNRLSDSIQQMRLEADQGIAEAVGIVNDALHNIKDLNEEIATRHLGGRSAADLEDQRDRYLDALSEQMDVQYLSRTNGEIVILTQTGRTLLDSQVHELSVDGRSVITPASLYDADPTQRGVATVTLSTPDGDIDLLARNEISDGRIAGFVEIRDTLMPQAQAQLDELAHHLALALSTGEISGSPVQSIAETADFDEAAWPLTGSADTSGDVTVTIDGTAITLTNVAVTGASPADRGAALAAAVEDALRTQVGLSGITVAYDDSGANQTLVFTDSESREISSFEIDDGGGTTAPTAAAIAAPYSTSTLDVGSIARPGDTVSLSVIDASTGEPKTIALTATETATGEPNTFLLGATPAGTAASIQLALTAQLPPGFTLTLNGTQLEVQDTVLADSTRLIGVSATSQTGSGEHFELFADGAGLDQTSYLGNPLGATDDQKLGFAQRIAVSESVLADSSLLVLYTDPATGLPVPDGDPARPLDMLRRLTDMPRSYDSSVGLGPVNTTIEDFAVGLVSFQAGQVAMAEDRLDYQIAITESVERRFDAVSGVNVDEEMAELLLLERTYAASAQILSAVERMLDDLLAAVQ